MNYSPERLQELIKDGYDSDHYTVEKLAADCLELTKRVEVAAKILVLIESGKFINGDRMTLGAMRSLACSTLVDMGMEDRLRSAEAQGSELKPPRKKRPT